jgi:hypothetical protein
MVSPDCISIEYRRSPVLSGAGIVRLVDGHARSPVEPSRNVKVSHSGRQARQVCPTKSRRRWPCAPSRPRRPTAVSSRASATGCWPHPSAALPHSCGRNLPEIESWRPLPAGNQPGQSQLARPVNRGGRRMVLRSVHGSIARLYGSYGHPPLPDFAVASPAAIVRHCGCP